MKLYCVIGISIGGLKVVGVGDSEDSANHMSEKWLEDVGKKEFGSTVIHPCNLNELRE